MSDGQREKPVQWDDDEYRRRLYDMLLFGEHFHDDQGRCLPHSLTDAAPEGLTAIEHGHPHPHSP